MTNTLLDVYYVWLPLPYWSALTIPKAFADFIASRVCAHMKTQWSGRGQYEPKLTRTAREVHPCDCNSISDFKRRVKGAHLYLPFTTPLPAAYNLSKLFCKQMLRVSTVLPTNFSTNINRRTQTPVSAIGRSICPSYPSFTLPVFAGWSIEPFLSLIHSAVKSPPNHYLEISLCLSQPYTPNNTPPLT